MGACDRNEPIRAVDIAYTGNQTHREFGGFTRVAAENRLLLASEVHLDWSGLLVLAISIYNAFGADLFWKEAVPWLLIRMLKYVSRLLKLLT